jgi:hypothetical protein
MPSAVLIIRDIAGMLADDTNASHHCTVLEATVALSGAMGSMFVLLSMREFCMVPDMALFVLDTGSPQCVIPAVAAPCALSVTTALREYGSRRK